MPTRGPTRSMSASASFATASGRTPILQGDQGRPSSSLLGDAGQQVLSRRRRRQALRRAAAADPARRACRRRPDRRVADSGRLRRAAARLRADRRRPTREARVHRRHADLAQPPADHPRRRARDRRISLLRPRQAQHPLRRDDGRARARRAPATSSCSTAAATTRPAPTSTPSNGPRSRGVVAERGLLPFVDIAYQGFGRGLEEDAAGLRGMLAGVRRSDRRAKLRQEFQRLSRPRRLAVRQDRLGARRPRRRWRHVLQRAREMWSMPPDHGAAAVRIVLDDAAAARRLAGRARRDARPHQLGPPAHRRRRPAPRLSSASSSACSRCCR